MFCSSRHLSAGASFLGIDPVGPAVRRLGRRLARVPLFGPFSVRAAVSLPSRRLALTGCWLDGLLNYDVVLNVELVVHVHNVDLHTALRACFASWVSASSLWRLPRSSTLHIGWNDPLDVEILLLLLLVITTGSSLMFSTCGVSTSTIGLLLDILSWMLSTHRPTHTTYATLGLRGRGILAIGCGSWIVTSLLVLTCHRFVSSCLGVVISL